MRDIRYKPAKSDIHTGTRFVPAGHSLCLAGYIDCPEIGDHYHCGNCGGVSGFQGHYSKLPGQTDWQFNCPELSEDARQTAPASAG